MPIPVRRAALALMLEGIKIGHQGIAIDWSDAARMSVRYAEGRLVDPSSLATEDTRRPARPLLLEGAEQAPALPEKNS